MQRERANGEASQYGLLLTEIERIVSEAAQTSAVLRTQDHAARLLESYPDFSLGRIINEIVATAAIAKVPVEIERPKPSD